MCTNTLITKTTLDLGRWWGAKPHYSLAVVVTRPEILERAFEAMRSPANERAVNKVRTWRVMRALLKKISVKEVRAILLECPEQDERADPYERTDPPKRAVIQQRTNPCKRAYGRERTEMRNALAEPAIASPEVKPRTLDNERAVSPNETL